MPNTSLVLINLSTTTSSRKNLSVLSLHALAACWLGMVFDGMDTYNYILTMHPALADLLHTSSTAQIGAHGAGILALFMCGWAIGASFFGMLADRIGRTKTLIFSVLTYALFTGLCAWSHSWQELALYRFFVGCGIGGEASIGGVMLAEIWKGKSRLHAASFLQSGFPCGFLLLAFINLFIGHFGWRYLYLVGMVPAFLAFYMRMKMDDAPDAKRVLNYKNSLRCRKQGELQSHELNYLKQPLFELFSKENRQKTIIAVLIGSCISIGAYAI